MEEYRHEKMELEDGSTLHRTYSQERLLRERIVVNHVSGLRWERVYNGNRELVEEDWRHGVIAIGLHIQYAAGRPVDETYIVNSRTVSLAKYEKARNNHPDMPLANSEIGSSFADAIAALKAQERKKRAARRIEGMDSVQAASDDAFCAEILAKGVSLDASKFLAEAKNTLGTMTHSESLRFVAHLSKLGAGSVMACEIDDYGGEGANTGHIVVSLPVDEEARLKMFNYLSRVSKKIGYGPCSDNGQHLQYVKLD